MAKQTAPETKAINLNNILLNGRKYRLTNFLEDWTIEEDEMALEIIDPFLSKLVEGFNFDKPMENIKMNFDVEKLYNLIIRQKAHRTLFALLFRPVNGDKIDESVELEERSKDMGKLSNPQAWEGFKSFFVFVTNSQTGDSLISFEVQKSEPEQTPET